MALVGQSGWARAGSSSRATLEPSSVSLGTPALSLQHPKVLHTRHKHKTICQCLMHQQRARQEQIKLPVTKETGTGDTGPAACHVQFFSIPNSRRTQGLAGGAPGGCRHTLPPAGEPGCTLRNAEATQCKFFGFVAAAPLPWSRGREQTQLAPCFLSTFHPTAFGPSAGARLPGPAPAVAVPHPAHSRELEMEQGLSQPSRGKGGTVLVQGLIRDTQSWQGMERRWRFGRECHVEM